MSLFGKIKDAFTSDLGTFLTQGTNGLDRKRDQALRMAELQRLQGVRERLMSDYDQAMTPQYPQAQSFDPALEGSPDQPMTQGTPQPDRTEMLRQAFMRAQLQGLPLGGADKTLESMAPDYEVINGGDGAYGLVNKGTGDVRTGQLPNQYQALVEELKRQQIEAAKAAVFQKQAMGRKYDAQAKTGGFAPKQPKTSSSAKPVMKIPPGNWSPL